MTTPRKFPHELGPDFYVNYTEMSYMHVIETLHAAGKPQAAAHVLHIELSTSSLFDHLVDRLWNGRPPAPTPIPKRPQFTEQQALEAQRWEQATAEADRLYDLDARPDDYASALAEAQALTDPTARDAALGTLANFHASRNDFEAAVALADEVSLRPSHYAGSTYRHLVYIRLLNAFQNPPLADVRQPDQTAAVFHRAQFVGYLRDYAIYSDFGVEPPPQPD